MAIKSANLVGAVTTVTSTGNVPLTPLNGRQDFSTAFSTGGSDEFFYFISSRESTEWEVGTGSLDTTASIVRDTIIDGSNSTSAVNFTAGTKDVVSTIPYEYRIGGSGYIYGVEAANSTVDADHDIVCSTGFVASDDADPVMLHVDTSLTKQADATWAAGNAAGGNLDGTTLTASGTLHMWAIGKADGTVDIACSDHDTSGLSPTLPTGYIYKRRICSLRMNSSSNMLQFTQHGDLFTLNPEALELNRTTAYTSKDTVITIPKGIVVEALMSTYVFVSSAGQNGTINLGNAGGTAFAKAQGFQSSHVVRSQPDGMISNTDGEIRIHYSVAAGAPTGQVRTRGYKDTRGRLE